MNTTYKEAFHKLLKYVDHERDSWEPKAHLNAGFAARWNFARQLGVIAREYEKEVRE